MMNPNIVTIPLRHCNFEAKVRMAGDGPPLVYLHAAGGPIWDPFVEGLCESHTVYAPHHPGTGETAREAVYGVENLWDLVLIYDELFDALDLKAVPIIGTSFGGMMACEIGAKGPDKISGDDRRLLRIARHPQGRPHRLRAEMLVKGRDKLLRRHHHIRRDRRVLAPQPDRIEHDHLGHAVRPMRGAGKFVWPIPDKGLKKRLHRVTADTLIVWGEDDALVSSVYAKEFGARISKSRVEIIHDCGHVPQVERLDVLKPMVAEFLEAPAVDVT